MKLKFERNGILRFIIMYSLYLYFLGLSLRNTSKALKISRMIKEVMCLYGIGFRNLVLLKSIKEKEYLHS